MTKYQKAIVIGRYQIYHKGHEQLTSRALEIADEVLVIVGSSFQSRNIRNPFKWTERAAMITATLAEGDQARLRFLPVRDYYDDMLWNADVRRQVSACVFDADRIVLVGFKKDDTSYYLDNFPDWSMVEIESKFDINATALRNQLFAAENAETGLASIANRISMPVREFLNDWSNSPEYAVLKAEYTKIDQANQVYAGIPWDIIATTVDAVVTVNNHVLLGKRKHFPGKGLWAIPGGFLEKRESLLQGAIRELKEETSLNVPDDALRDCLQHVKVFSHPRRSCRGRVITHAHHFALGTPWLDKTWPEIKAADDLESVAWVPITQLPALEEELFEDHFAILCNLLSIQV
ncbi:bifunctional nicotinamide-nucleotide adenylyltransferase/Nudix hydroxylase [Methylomonas rosea]|uniref:Bifunctional nicotinamide-nucleotide adenylyltransferase/Nudix hydroxylase n=1 Tax=Methylomonas rosea TaxID=2952227 RepID=A0ABT1TT32_9GAMM|nr:bifunctional nicotinamide-nucleotide adenylyltransferase/Nudix hydroxylase [Methylomonas sp. WSC-7]MCQ8117934.1 bifunctional nicotinamide-nucleotide adenylyltransferase/Nudix hydroxylase [Methylomonas sp. WSC-7]